MTVIELHPDDLVDKSARGELSPEERERLDAHLARCAACRAEVTLRADFAEELEAGDRPSLTSLVQAALASGEAVAPPQPPRADTRDAERDPIPVAFGHRERRQRRALFFVAAACLASGAAAGASGAPARVWNALGAVIASSREAPERGTAVGAPRIGQPAATTRRERTDEGVLDARAPLEEAAALPEPPSSEPELVRPPPPHERAVAAPRLTPPREPARAWTAPTTLPAVASRADPPAGELFDGANRARRAGDVAAALAGYERLGRLYPESREARVAAAAAGRLLLDRGDPSGALGRFDAYLGAGASELREEVMASRAIALERLGRVVDERRAWTTLLAEYPSTPHAGHAQRRIAEIPPP